MYLKGVNVFEIDVTAVWQLRDEPSSSHTLQTAAICSGRELSGSQLRRTQTEGNCQEHGSGQG
jgi:hypothetical protein